MDDDRPKKKPVHEVGMALEAMSLSELGERIVLLENEIARLKTAIDAKSASLSAAESVFKI
jgi:uncharacterized small protein (DUF1192 family)